MSDTPKTVYLLGAGASANSLPLASNLSSAIGEAVDLIKKKIEEEYGTPGMPYPDEKRPWPRGPIGKNLIESFDWLSSETTNTTIDNFARILYLRFRNSDALAEKKLYRLKSVLSCYFLFIQSIIRTDRRYDEFFAKILKSNNISLPENLSIFTWNYDVLLEKSYYQLVNDIEKTKKAITNSDNVVRLNGIAGISRPSHHNLMQQNYYPYGFVEAIYQSGYPLPVSSIVKLFDSYSANPFERLLPQMEFAWEANPNVIENAKKRADNTEILVVVGYSFPDFNREVDRAILSQMASTISEVHVQVPDQPVGNHMEMKMKLKACFGQDGFSRIEKNIKLIDSVCWFYRPSNIGPY